MLSSSQHWVPYAHGCLGVNKATGSSTTGRIHQLESTHPKPHLYFSLFQIRSGFFLSFSNGQLKNESVPHFQQFASQKNKVKKDIYSSNLK